MSTVGGDFSESRQKVGQDVSTWLGKDYRKLWSQTFLDLSGCERYYDHPSDGMNTSYAWHISWMDAVGLPFHISIWSSVSIEKSWCFCPEINISFSSDDICPLDEMPAVSYRRRLDCRREEERAFWAGEEGGVAATAQFWQFDQITVVRRH